MPWSRCATSSGWPGLASRAKKTRPSSGMLASTIGTARWWLRALGSVLDDEVGGAAPCARRVGRLTRAPRAVCPLGEAGRTSLATLSQRLDVRPGEQQTVSLSPSGEPSGPHPAAHGLGMRAGQSRGRAHVEQLLGLVVVLGIGGHGAKLLQLCGRQQ